jgi:hypothetical protein
MTLTNFTTLILFGNQTIIHTKLPKDTPIYMADTIKGYIISNLDPCPCQFPRCADPLVFLTFPNFHFAMTTKKNYPGRNYTFFFYAHETKYLGNYSDTDCPASPLYQQGAYIPCQALNNSIFHEFPIPLDISVTVPTTNSSTRTRFEITKGIYNLFFKIN